MKKMLFLVNPNAGHGGIRPAMLDVLGILSSQFELTVFITTGPGQITSKIAREGMHYDTVAVSGGDGSLSEAISGINMLPTEQRPVLGYLPAGTTNDVAFSLSISNNPVTAAKTILEGREVVLDSGTLNGQTFAYVAAFGAFTAVTYATPQEEKRALGYFAYILEGAKALGEIKPIHARITADGITYEGDFLVGGIGNTYSVGGMRNPLVKNLEISLNDGVNEALFIRNQADPLQFAAILGEMMLMDISNQEHFLFLKAKELFIEFNEDVPWTIDGESGGIHRSCTIQNVPGAVRIMAPAECSVQAT